MITEYLRYGIISRALNRDLFSINTINLRDHAHDKDGRIDSGIYGHGKGMLFRPEPLYDALAAIKKNYPSSRTLYLTPRGRKFDNIYARELSREDGITLICARYEGIDSRIVDALDIEEISIGDYVLSGGELAALVVLDSVSRFIEGSIKENSREDESFENGLLEYDHFTEPVEYLGKTVPPALRKGSHSEAEKLRLRSSLKKTYFNRPDLLFNYNAAFMTGETGDRLKKLKRQNMQMREYLGIIQNISKEWKNGRRN